MAVIIAFKIFLARVSKLPMAVFTAFKSFWATAPKLPMAVFIAKLPVAESKNNVYTINLSVRIFCEGGSRCLKQRDMPHCADAFRFKENFEPDCAVELCLFGVWSKNVPRFADSLASW